jgi:succinate dehydrogenase / fumarate reductase iron-sulfur subunit
VEVTLRIRRYNPDIDHRHQFKDYVVDIEPTDRVLDALNVVKWQQDGTLTYRRSCGHGVCGTDAMRINGRNRLACKLLLQELGSRITIEPLIGFPVIKDLVVDMEPFFSGYRSIKPYLIADDPPSRGERLQSIEQRERYDDTSKCILCAACTSACGSSIRVRAHGVAGRSSTAPRLARVASKSNTRSAR